MPRLSYCAEKKEVYMFEADFLIPPLRYFIFDGLQAAAVCKCYIAADAFK